MADGAFWLFAVQIALLRANTKGGGEGEIGQMITFADALHQGFDALAMFHALSAKDVKHRSACVLGLQFIL